MACGPDVRNSVPVLLGATLRLRQTCFMQFNDGSAGGYGGAGGAAGAADEDDDGKQLPVDCLHTVWHIFCFTLKFAGQYCLLEATLWSVSGFAIHCMRPVVCVMLMAGWLISRVHAAQFSMCVVCLHSSCFVNGEGLVS